MGAFSRKNTTKRIILNTNIEDTESEIEMLNGEIKNLRNQIALLTRECVNNEKDIVILHVVLILSGIVHLFVAWYIIQLT
jgi:hypothetical protein